MFNEVDYTKVPLSKHRIAQRHEPTGRYANPNFDLSSLTNISRGNLYIGSYNHHIEGLPVEEGRRITDELVAHVTQDKYKFSLHWENPGVRHPLIPPVSTIPY
jgi:alpha-ketoglutarate-dependent 2,4-dichlorophenoxyacetate dioxygenase